MSLIGSVARTVLHPVQFAEHVGDTVWHEAAKKVLGGDPSAEEVYGRSFTAEELAAARKYKRAG